MCRKTCSSSQDRFEGLAHTLRRTTKKPFVKKKWINNYRLFKQKHLARDLRFLTFRLRIYYYFCFPTLFSSGFSTLCLLFIFPRAQGPQGGQSSEPGLATKK